MPEVAKTPGMTAVERLLVNLDTAPWGGLYRVAIGLMVPPALSRLVGHEQFGWVLVPFLLVILAALRIIPVVLRRLVPFSEPVGRIWAKRRQLAKRYDSYQWRKLLWIGLGIAIYLALSGWAPTSCIAVSSICIVAGAGGMARWRAVGSHR